MGSSRSRRHPPGGQPYDAANGLRVGVLAGGLAGAGITALFGPGAVWAVFAGAAIGGAVGYASERRRLRRWRDRTPD
jgi:hypothetical protein